MANSKIAGLQWFDGIIERRCGGAGKAWMSARGRRRMACQERARPFAVGNFNAD